MKPFVKWAGGKRQLVPVIKELLINEITEDSIYYEPFVGGGAVFFGLAPKNAVINDYNKELINVYEVIRDYPKSLMTYLKFHKQNHNHDYYYQVRNLDRASDFNYMTDVQKAARTIYLNRTCFNGLYRVNKKGQFNTPIGRNSWEAPEEDNLQEISAYLNNNNIQIQHGDFEQAVPNPKKGDIAYFDPPYDYHNQEGFTGYTAKGFTRDNLIRLKNFCDKIIDQGCTVLISNNDTDFVRETFNDERYQINEILVTRNMNRTKSVPEVLIYGKGK